MNHSVPPPSLPPDIDDLYTPPPHLRAGVMAKHVWSFMRLSLTNTDWAWCTVCRKWCRYHKAFHDEHIKALFKHCKNQHVLDSSSGRVCPINPSSAPSASQPTFHQIPTHTHNPTITQLPIPPNPSNPQVLQQPLLNAILANQPAPQPQFPQSISNQARLQLAHAQATRNQLAMLANLAQSSSQQHQPPPTHQQLQAAVATIASTAATARACARARARAPAAVGPQPLANTLHVGAAPRGRSAISVQMNPAAAAAALSNFHTLALPQPSNVPQITLDHANARNQQLDFNGSVSVQPVDGLDGIHRVIQRGAAQMGVQAPVAPMSSFGRNGMTGANGMQQNVAAVGVPPPAVRSPITSEEMGPAAVDRSIGRLRIGAANGQNLSHLNGLTPQISSLSINGVNNLAVVSGPTPSRAQTLQQRPNPAAMSTSHNPAPSARTVSNSQSSLRPLQGAIAKKSANPAQNRSHITKIRCEASAQVRKVAERSQQLMFKGTNLYFANASFQVPSSEAEAIEIMRRGTYDVDKDNEGRPANDLYFVSWSHTQFFAAQMAALGYRFVSSNLRRSVKQTTPPPLNDWLLLEKYMPGPRPPQMASNTTSDASGLSAPSSASQGAQGPAQSSNAPGSRSSAGSGGIHNPSVGGRRDGAATGAQAAGSGQVYSGAAAAGASNGHGNQSVRMQPPVVRAGVGMRQGPASVTGNATHGSLVRKQRPKKKLKDIPVIDLT